MTWPDTVADPPGMSASWPLATTLPLGALPGATPCARLHARAVLTEWGLADLAEAGATLADVLKTTVFVASADRADLVAAWDVVSAAFGEHDAPSTLLGVTVLGYPGQLVEIEAVAVAAEG